MRKEFEACLRLDALGMEQFRRSTACDAKDKATAQRFFNDVYQYALEGSEDPDVEDYRAPLKIAQTLALRYNTGMGWHWGCIDGADGFL